MPKLEYSTEASNVINRFYKVDSMVYVEGDDDVAFWEWMFEKLSTISIEIQPVGGKPEVKKYADKIANGELNAIVAMDTDFSILGRLPEHSNILLTYGYSIENTIISSSSVRIALKNIARLSSKSIPIEVCNQWIEGLHTSTDTLVLYDMVNYLDASGVCVVGDNCSRFLKSKTSVEICDNKILDFIRKLGLILDEERKSVLEEQLRNLGRTLRDFIRGHFLFSAAHCFISNYIKTHKSPVSLSREALYSNLLLSFQQIFDNKHPHYNYYESIINKIQT
ncbi:DUF4435 domain-containing protein [Nodosilinea nodulosa]|uniref:DUF4435 domain-containing protein n=1 Tax=Nodosilinea nodulosa TaxID=416001 RepID=UPI0003786C8C|nr:DUF4435 domain-containing protein [Nodosilinea nodulosa]